MESPSPSNLAMDPCGMRIFEGRYFNINRQLLMCLGLWPYQSKSKRYISRVIVIVTLVLMSVPQLIDVIVHTEDVDRQVLSTLSFLTLWIMILKMIGMILSRENLKEMFKRIAYNWQFIQDKNARDILHKYSERARTVTIFYIAYVMGPALFACTLPAIPKIFDKIMPTEKPRTEIYLVEGEYFIDKKTHYQLFFFLNFFGITFVAFICTVYETMYIVSVEHCCALYAVVRSRLLTLGQTVRENTLAAADSDSNKWLLQTVQLHQHTLIFNSKLNDSYSLTFMFVLSVSLVIFPLSCWAIMSQFHNLLNLIPYAIFTLHVAIQGIFLLYPGQRIINHQLSISDAAYCNKWYTEPLHTKKLLSIFMLRCSKPATITAGYLEMNNTLYFKIIKTAFSYVAVSRNFR